MRRASFVKFAYVGRFASEVGTAPEAALAGAPATCGACARPGCPGSGDEAAPAGPRAPDTEAGAPVALAALAPPGAPARGVAQAASTASDAIASDRPGHPRIIEGFRLRSGGD